MHRLKFNFSYRNMLFMIFFIARDDFDSKGYPSYTTSASWLGYTDSKLRELCQKYLRAGWTRFVQVCHL